MDDQHKKELIYKELLNEFKIRGMAENDYFDYNVWFINKFSNTSSLKNFKEMLTSTPSETDDIIKFILYKAYIRGNNDNFELRVSQFIEETSDLLVSLYNQLDKLEGLISKYNSYDLVTKLEHLLTYQYSNKFDVTKSTITTKLTKIEGTLPQGDYLINLCCGFAKDESKSSVLEYKMNSIIKSSSNLDNLEECFFSPVEFYSFETQDKNNQDSGTNLLYVFLKCENLNLKSNKCFISTKRNFIEILLSNINLLINTHKKNKTFSSTFEVQLYEDTVVVHIDFRIEIDPITLFSISNKILLLQKNLISYQVQTQHKFSTILTYFSEIADKIKEILNTKEIKKDKCIIF